MPEGHRHLTHEERCRIGALKESGLSDGAIAARLDRERTSIWRELRRNGGDGGYSPGEAQGRAEARRSAASGVFQLDTVNSMSLSYIWAAQSTGTGRAGLNRSGIHGQGHAIHRIHAAGTSARAGITEYPGRISVPFAASDMIQRCAARPASS